MHRPHSVSHCFLGIGACFLILEILMILVANSGIEIHPTESVGYILLHLLVMLLYIYFSNQ